MFDPHEEAAYLLTLAALVDGKTITPDPQRSGLYRVGTGYAAAWVITGLIERGLIDTAYTLTPSGRMLGGAQ